jgi:hypothetical protein
VSFAPDSTSLTGLLHGAVNIAMINHTNIDVKSIVDDTMIDVCDEVGDFVVASTTVPLGTTIYMFQCSSRSVNSKDVSITDYVTFGSFFS